MEASLFSCIQLVTTTKFLCSGLSLAEPFAQGPTANGEGCGQDSDLDSAFVGLPLGHAALISQVWLGEKGDWGKGVFDHRDTRHCSGSTGKENPMGFQ